MHSEQAPVPAADAAADRDPAKEAESGALQSAGAGVTPEDGAAQTRPPSAVLSRKPLSRAEQLILAAEDSAPAELEQVCGQSVNDAIASRLSDVPAGALYQGTPDATFVPRTLWLVPPRSATRANVTSPAHVLIGRRRLLCHVAAPYQIATKILANRTPTTLAATGSGENKSNAAQVITDDSALYNDLTVLARDAPTVAPRLV